MSGRFFVVPAPGYYGSTCAVLSSHSSLRRALRAVAGDATVVVRDGAKHKGDVFTRASEAIYPAIEAECSECGDPFKITGPAARSFVKPEMCSDCYVNGDDE